MKDRQDIWANAHETHESLQQFLFANCLSISSHFVAVHSCSVHCSRRSQKSIKPLISKVQGLSKPWMLIRLKSSSLALVVIGSTACSCLSTTVLTKDWPTTVKLRLIQGYRCLMPSCAGFLEHRKSALGRSKSTFNAESFICSFSMSISIDFGAIRSWNVSCSPKSSKNP